MMQWIKATLYVCLSELSLDLTPTVVYSNAARDTKERLVGVYAVSIAPTMTIAVVVGSFLILFIKAT